MTGITSSLENFVSSIIGIFQNLLSSVLAVGQSILAVGTTFVSSVFELARSLLQFLLSNALIFGVLAAVFVGYVALQQRQGNSVSVPVGQGKRKKIA